jgi:hypothetical protein
MEAVNLVARKLRWIDNEEDEVNDVFAVSRISVLLAVVWDFLLCGVVLHRIG